jgi:hypothetical protein
MRQERGFTLISLLFLLALAAGVALVGFKIVPAYIDYFTIKHTLQNILAEDTDQTDVSLRSSLDRRLDVNFIKDIDSHALHISRDDGVLTLTVPIARKEHLAGGISICVDLEATASAPVKQ